MIYANPGGMLGNGQGGQPRDAFGGNGIQSSSQGNYYYLFIYYSKKIFNMKNFIFLKFF